QKRDVLKANVEMLSLIGSAISKRDSDTDEHNFRVTLYAIQLAERMQLDTQHRQSLLKGAFVHDIGKIAISDNILLKPGKLTDDEFEQMKRHVKEGVDIIKSSLWLADAKDVVAYHHEKYNGQGYPFELSGQDIPINARIFAVVDVFDALTSKRPYKEAMPYDKAIAIIQNDAGNHFDPNVVKAFKAISQEMYDDITHLNRESLSLRLESYIQRYFF
ncbi:MAG: HD-GYP domain-containing protein, partial [Gammaproteobacteria bacterium]|nr:HD-GYP domain-containing protein [Gammaproteobacteria bacterium]